jgi:hypothetical protein
VVGRTSIVVSEPRTAVGWRESSTLLTASALRSSTLAYPDGLDDTAWVRMLANCNLRKDRSLKGREVHIFCARGHQKY